MSVSSLVFLAVGFVKKHLYLEIKFLGQFIYSGFYANNCGTDLRISKRSKTFDLKSDLRSGLPVRRLRFEN